MSKIRIRLGKDSVFEAEYDKDDKLSRMTMVSKYMEFFSAFKEKRGGISARTWRFPPVVIDGEVKYKVTPNGSWEVA